MHVHIVLLEDFRFKGKFRSMRFQVLQGEHSRFFHDITKVSGEGQFTVSLTQGCLHEQYLTAGSSPGQSGYHTCMFVTVVFIPDETRWANDLLDIFRSEGPVVIIFKCNVFCHNPHKFGNLFIQLSYSRFPCMTFNDIFQCFYWNGQLFLCDSVIL